ncbi:MAG: chromate efflux transporter, partial [Pseudomonadota bacterium]
MTVSPPPTAAAQSSVLSIFLIFLRLGLTSFGGPIAHLGYFREEFVARRKWIDDAAYADLVALCQFLPGPASSQVGIGVGLLRGGYGGALAAWLGFTAPSALIMIAAAYGVLEFGGVSSSGWIGGLMIAAVAVVAQAVWGMARSLCPDRTRASLAIAAAVALLLVPSPWIQLAVIVVGALVGLVLVRPTQTEGGTLLVPVGRPAAIAALVAFCVLLVGLPILAAGSSSAILNVVDIFYRSGALVFGGGHVVLPLLQAEMVPSGLV